MATTQKAVNIYLKKHAISKLFEEMMAKIVKDMPNEPVTFLVKLLQKKHRVSEKSLTSSDLGLTGKPIPKKFSQDPQVVIPGSKPITSDWSKGIAAADDDEKRPRDHNKSPRDHNKSPRDYGKPWLSNAKSPTKAKKEKVSDEAPPTSWKKTSSSMGVKSYDELFETTSPRSTKITRSQTQQIISPRAQENKENGYRRQLSANVTNDELFLERSSSVTSEKKITISPLAYTKFKKQSSKRRSEEQKKKLKALLSNERSEQKNKMIESTDDEGIEIIENSTDLINEGVAVATKSRVLQNKRVEPPKTSTTEVKIGFCPKCSKVMDGSSSLNDSDGFFTPQPRQLFKSVSPVTDDDDFDSVSQIDTNKPYKPSWPVLSDSDGESLSPSLTAKNLEKRQSTKTPVQKSESSEFFEVNAKSKQKVNFVSDNESEATVTVKKSSLKTSKAKQAWNQSSEVDAFSEASLPKGNGWRQKSSLSVDGASDVE